MKKLLQTISLFTFIISAASAQDAIEYQKPPQAIADLLLAKPTPSIRIDSKAEWMLLSERNSYPTVEELGQPENRIAGLRLNPNNFSQSRQLFINSLSLKNLKTNQNFAIIGLPKSPLISSISWSPSEKKIAFLQTESDRVDLYVIDLANKKASKINQKPLNNIMGNAYLWVDDQTILYKSIIHAALGAPKKPITPKGPTIQQNIGKAAPRPTYQDLIKSPYDEQLFEYYAQAQLILSKNGQEKGLGKSDMFSGLSLSPDKNYVLTRTMKKPFSYVVTAYGFPTTVGIMDMSGKMSLLVTIIRKMFQGTLNGGMMKRLPLFGLCH